MLYQRVNITTGANGTTTTTPTKRSTTSTTNNCNYSIISTTTTKVMSSILSVKAIIPFIVVSQIVLLIVVTVSNNVWKSSYYSDISMDTTTSVLHNIYSSLPSAITRPLVLDDTIMKQLQLCNRNNVTVHGAFRIIGDGSNNKGQQVQQQQQQQQSEPICQWEVCVPFHRTYYYDSLLSDSERQRYKLIHDLCYKQLDISTTTSTSTSNNDNDNKNDTTTTSTSTTNLMKDIRQYKFQNKYINNVKQYIPCNDRKTIAIWNTDDNDNDKNRNNIIVPAWECTYYSTTKQQQQQQQHQSIIKQHFISNVFEQPPIELSQKIIPSNKQQQQDATTSKKYSYSFNEIQKLAKHHEPVQLSFSIFRHVENLTPFPDCDIPCLTDDVPGHVGTRYVLNTPIEVYQKLDPWSFTFSMEGPEYYSFLYIDTSSYKQNLFYSTTSYNSEVPLPYYSRAEYKIYHTNYVPYDNGIKGASFMANNCQSKNNREDVVQQLIDLSAIDNDTLFRVDSLSGCLTNAVPPNGIPDTYDKKRIMKQYLFYLAFENQNVDDYITEKLWGPLEVGTIPIYYGALNVKDHVPHNSIIVVTDYPSIKDLYHHLTNVANNRTLYESYHAWRFQPEPDHFRIKYDITDIHSTCRTCRWAYARIHGIGWNHTTQSLRPLTNIHSRQVCLSSNDNNNNGGGNTNNLLVQNPFIEEWVNSDGTFVTIEGVYGRSSSASTSYSSNDECQHRLSNSNRIININNDHYYRTVYNHDGIVDFIIEESDIINEKVITTTSSSSLILQLRLTMPVLQIDQITFRNVRDNIWHFQDNTTRYTILAVGETSNPMNNTIFVQSENYNQRIYLNVTVPMRVRIIVEDIDTFHLGADQEENYFGKLMTLDFLNPIERSVLVPTTL